MRGPRKTPPQLRVLRGTATRNAYRNQIGNVRTDSPLPALTAAPRAPSWLKNLDAVKEWNRLAPLLVTHGLLHDGNVTTFAHACALHGQLVAQWAAGETPTAALLAAHRALANSLALLDFPTFGRSEANRFAENASAT